MLKSWFLDSATARELSLTTTGHASRGVSSSPSPSPTNLHLEAGTVTPQQLIAEIKDGFYVTDLIGMGTNLVTGDYSRGASGLWIENGELTYAVSEVTIAGPSQRHFRLAHARERPRIPLWHERADVAAGGTDRCGDLIPHSCKPESKPRCARPERSRSEHARPRRKAGASMAARR